ncbi:MAG: cadherin repeat domain-containing protein, partial [Pseudomonadota bacterium]
TDTATVTLTVTGQNDAPDITTTQLSYAVDENTTAVATFAASDPDTGDTLSYSIGGGADAALFTIDSVTGALSFIAAPDFETPLDDGGDNVYDVDVTVSDGTLTDTESVQVTVNDVDEGPGPGPNIIQGTNIGYEVLVGTSGEDQIRSGGGFYDRMIGGADADVFVFEDGPGRQMMEVADYEVGVDAIDLGGQSILFDISFGNLTYLYLDGGEFDTILVRGAGDVSDITFVDVLTGA